LAPEDYNTPLMERAEGVFIEDPDGNVFIDFISGRCVVNTGHRHPRVVEALRNQLERGFHWQGAESYRLAQRLGGLLGMPGCQAYWTQSGSMANDFALKAVRRATGRPQVICFHGSYHGASYAGISLSGYHPDMKRGYGPLIPGIHHIPYATCYRCPLHLDPDSCGVACLEFLERAAETVVAEEEVAAVFLEPVLGDAGWYVPPTEWVKGVADWCRSVGALLVVDEIQTGMGRTGKWFASEHLHVKGDVVLVGKALASGLPLAACVIPGNLLDPKVGGAIPIHAQSFMANPLSVAAAHATLDTIDKEDLCRASEKKGVELRKALAEMGERFPFIGDVRGLGLLVGVDIVETPETKKPNPVLASSICREAFKRGLFMLAMGSPGGAVLRVAPPLVITEEELEAALQVLEEAMASAQG